MGGTPSKTRKITIENDNPTSVIRVSDDVVDRLRGKQKEVSIQAHEQSILPVPPGGVIGAGGPIYFSDPGLTSIQLRQARIEELKKNDEYWSNRVKKLEENHKKMNEIMEQEYQRTIEEETKSHPIKTDLDKMLPPCHGNKTAIIQCYKEHPSEPMRCAKLVQAFQKCVDMKREALISHRSI